MFGGFLAGAPPPAPAATTLGRGEGTSFRGAFCPARVSHAGRGGLRRGAAERSGVGGPVGPEARAHARCLGHHDRRSERRHRHDRHGREPDSRPRRRARPRLGLRRQRPRGPGSERARDAGGERDCGPGQQRRRHGGVLLAVQGDADPGLRQPEHDRRRDHVRRRARRSRDRHQPHAARLAALGGGVRGSICPRPRGRGDRVGREQRQRGNAVSGRVPRGAGRRGD